jgi:SAM-dependent methyltransferase
MFFPERIKSIKKSDRVLEIGPGSTPHSRSDEFLELSYNNDEEEQSQFGHTGKLETIKKIHFYDGTVFPFEDKEFDYVICSHVLEHVEDIPGFLKEIFRISKGGYLEYPNMYYDYLFNFDVHLNFISLKNSVMYWKKKKDTPLSSFSKIQNKFYELLSNSQFKGLINNNKELFVEGFEWDSEFEIIESTNFSELIDTEYRPQEFELNTFVEKNISFKDLIKILFRKIRNKLR